jgi:hypothetical protein
MAKDYRAITADISAYTAQLRKAQPEAMQGFYALAKGPAPRARSTRRPRNSSRWPSA